MKIIKLVKEVWIPVVVSIDFHDFNFLFTSKFLF